jgi:hypothetical protein
MLPQVSSAPEFWICFRQLQGASPPKRIITLGWVDLWERQCQFRAAVLPMRSRHGGGSLAAWGGMEAGDDVGSFLTYIGEDLGLVLGL